MGGFEVMRTSTLSFVINLSQQVRALVTHYTATTRVWAHEQRTQRRSQDVLERVIQVNESLVHIETQFDLGTQCSSVISLDVPILVVDIHLRPFGIFIELSLHISSGGQVIPSQFHHEIRAQFEFKSCIVMIVRSCLPLEPSHFESKVQQQR